MIHRTALALATAALALGFSGNVLAQSKVAFVNAPRLLAESPAAKAADDRLKAEFEKEEKALLDQQNALRAMAEKLDKDAPVLSDSERKKREAEFLEKERAFKAKGRDFQDRLNKRRDVEVGAIVEKINKIIQRIAETEKYDLIVQEAAYYNPKIDITPKVLQALNASK